MTTGDGYYDRIRGGVREFLRLEAAGGVVLLAAALLALLAANSGLAGLYAAFLELPVEVRVGELDLAKPLLLWINDGLMAVFFLLVGLEIKREIVEGELSSVAQALLPGLAAAGGMLVPALLYLFFNASDPVALRGWAIPVATDIAFAVGVLSLLGARAPPGAKVFLLALAIFDDLGAIVVIALFYTASLSLASLALAAAVLCVMLALNRSGVRALAPYCLLGIALWVCVLESGVHATLAGVATALAIPVRGEGERSPLRRLEHALHPGVAFGVTPLFGFANAGLSFSGLTLADLGGGVSLGIVCGLFVGKQLGVFAVVLAAVGLRLARLPEGVGFGTMYGLALLAGIGFTMSLFIGTLAWPDPGRLAAVRLGVLAGSLLSGLAGYAVLRFLAPR